MVQKSNEPGSNGTQRSGSGLKCWQMLGAAVLEGAGFQRRCASASSDRLGCIIVLRIMATHSAGGEAGRA